ncbi:carbon storage regulator CsrA [Vampirovibrio sp.]|uniref:carbon storage regulator CsrA n=1 Tax=Vampirovibrio sp. TaxID=2717857 RepID=UPI00359364CB
MLVLTRKTGQKIIIANEIEITILETKGDAVKIGIEAPKQITIYREEIFEEIKKSNRQATEQAQAIRLNEAIEAVNLIKPSSPKREG